MANRSRNQTRPAVTTDPAPDDGGSARPTADSPVAETARSGRGALSVVGDLNRFSTLLIGALLAMLGFALAVQLRSNAQTDSLSGAREEDLVRILDDQNSRVDRLQAQISDLQAAKLRLSDSDSNNAAARQEAQRQSDALAVLTGTVPAHGPGVQVSITDPNHQLKAEDLLDVIEELRGAGAEVIQFGSVRVGASSAFADVPSGVSLDGNVLRAPYLVLAIGDPKTMDTALNIPTGVVSTVRNAGGQAAINRMDLISINALRGNPAPKFATPSPK